MRITVLAVSECPGARLALHRIAQVLDGRSAEVELVEVTDEEEAVRRGMTGSPTILIDGVDPFAEPGASGSISCRLYRAVDGLPAGSPSVHDLHRALLLAPVSADGECALTDAAGRGGRGRLAPVTDGLRSVQRAVLRHFATTGLAPGPADLEAAARTAGRAVVDVLSDLADEDFLVLDPDGRIRAAYPFSTEPTAHHVHFADGTTAYSMCAVDALGIPAMLDTDAVITSTDPVSGEPITVTSTGGRTTWQPDTAVVYVGQRSCTGPAADVACDALNFFTGQASARTWAEQHPDVTGRIVDQTEAETLGRAIFGHLMTRDERET